MNARAFVGVAVASWSLALACRAPEDARIQPASRPAPAVPETLRLEDVPSADPLEFPALDVNAHADERLAYVRFVESLDLESFARDYPKLVADLSGTPRARELALKMCGDSEDARCLPWVVDALTSPDPGVRQWAGAAICHVVSGIELRRRDKTRPGGVYLLPRKAGDPDLRPLRWVVVEMARSGEPTLSGGAATMAGYLGLTDLAPTLEVLKGSRHPAVVGAAHNALEQLERDL